MKRLFLLALLVLASSTFAQNRIEVGLQAAGDRDRGYKAVSIGLSGRAVIKLGSTAIDGSVEYVFHAPKVAPEIEPGGRTIITDVLVRRYVVGGVYAVAGVDVSRLSTVLLDVTAAGAATGLGVEFGDSRIQFLYQPPDFTSDQRLSGYRLEAEQIKRIGEKHYVSFRLQGQASRFERSGVLTGTLTGERFGIVVSVGRFF